ncbi:MAG: hypothetical protein LBK58_11175 [Prevotellaceae bacterium]|jgi:hypothetical protein|nr:hypothetical protein [Prevotellaceae bacterium]
MKKVTGEAYQLAKYIHDWICVHAMSIQSNSLHTIRGYKVTLSLFVEFLEKEKKSILHLWLANVFHVNTLKNRFYG